MSLFSGDFNAHHTQWGCHDINIFGIDLAHIFGNLNYVIINDGAYAIIRTFLLWAVAPLSLTLQSLPLT